MRPIYDMLSGMKSNPKRSRTEGNVTLRAANRRKQRKTFSLSTDTVEFLQAFQKDRGEPSLTAALEEILRDRRRQARMSALSHSVSAYYDSLTLQERSDERAWAEFAESQLTDPDR